MRRFSARSTRLLILVVIGALVAFTALLASVGADAAPRQRHASTGGGLVQLPGPSGCLVDRSKRGRSCGPARALKGPGPFMGSRAIALSPNAKNLYVASSESDAIAIFKRNPKTGVLTQPKGAGGCIAARGGSGCASAVGLDAPNSVAVSADGHNVYATSRDSNAVTAFRRSPKTGALVQLPGGCIAAEALPGCASGRALLGPDVIVLSPDGTSVYVGSFFGNEVAVFDRNPSGGALTQPAGAGGCIAETAAEGCGLGIALKSPEGMAISSDGANLYLASALSNALVTFSRNPSSGALTQATDGSGCIVESPLAGCTSGVQLSGANAVAIAPGDQGLYVTSLFSNSVTSFTRSTNSGALAQMPGTSGCLIFLRAAGCSFGRALRSPEGIVVSPDGLNAYAAAYSSDAIAVLDRGARSGSLAQKPGRAGCLAPHSVPGCSRARALAGVSSFAFSPDGRYLYATAAESDAVDVFRRKGGS